MQRAWQVLPHWMKKFKEACLALHERLFTRRRPTSFLPCVELLIAMASYLQEKHDAIIALYQTHRGSVLELQATLCNETLPRLVQELDVNDRSSQLAREWIDDSGKYAPLAYSFDEVS
jgi:hypothetical protein